MWGRCVNPGTGLAGTLGACAALYLLAMMEVFTQVFGESLFYHALLGGIFLCAASWGRGREREPFVPAAWLALVGGSSAAAVFYVVSLSLRFRTRWLGELKAKLSEDAGLIAALKAGGGVLAAKAVATSPVPALLVAGALCVVTGWLAGSAIGAVSGGSSRGALTGALVACLAFALALLPALTVFQIGLGAGVLNAVAALELWRRAQGGRAKGIAVAAVLGLLAAGLLASGKIRDAIDRNIFAEEAGTRIVRRIETPFQTITLVASLGGAERVLYLNHYLQFTYRVASAMTPGGIDNQRSVLVHPPIAMHAAPEEVLILGGGDGLSAREVLKSERVKRITNVDRDRQWLEFSAKDEEMARMNDGALRDPRVALRFVDPFDYVRAAPSESVDVVLKDFPEGIGERLGRSVSVEFFRDVRRVLRPGGILSIHSDYYATASFWTIARALREAGFSHIVALNDNFASPDVLEGILWASDRELALDRLPADARGKFLLDAGVLPPIEGLAHDSDPRFIDYQIATAGEAVNSLYQPVYLKRLREENGFFLPLVYQIGVY